MPLSEGVRGRSPVRLHRRAQDVAVPETPTAQGPCVASSVSLIPCYINNRNRLTSTRALCEWLLNAGTQRIVILDNASSYEPLLAWYKELPSGISVKYQANLGPWSFWTENLHLEQSTPYIVSDADIVPSDICPPDLIAKMQSVLLSNPGCGKCGPSLRLDDIPEISREFITHGDGKGWEGEGVFYKRRHSADAFYAPLDTTLAIYNAYSPWVPADWNNLRLDAPYNARHMPWYVDKLTEEEKYYRDHADNVMSHISWPSPLNDYLMKGSE